VVSYKMQVVRLQLSLVCIRGVKFNAGGVEAREVLTSASFEEVLAFEAGIMV
jgi:hypothetical protein